jgi:hypothetical protein
MKDLSDPIVVTAEELERARESVAGKVEARRHRRTVHRLVATSAVAVVAAGAIVFSTIPASAPSLSTTGQESKAQGTLPVRVPPTSSRTPTSSPTTTPLRTTTPTTINQRRGTTGGGMVAFSLPYFVGMSQSQASSNEYLQLLNVYWVSDPDSTAPAGTITAEFVASNLGAPGDYSGSVTHEDLPSVTLGSEIGLTVSGGPSNVEVPDVVGLSYSDALQEMTQAGLVAKVQYECVSTSPDNAVLSESPSDGTEVEPGSAIALTENDGC